MTMHFFRSHFGPSPHHNPAPLLAPFPPSFPLGDEGVFSTLYARSLYVCSPGAASTHDQVIKFRVLSKNDQIIKSS